MQTYYAENSFIQGRELNSSGTWKKSTYWHLPIGQCSWHKVFTDRKRLGHFLIVCHFHAYTFGLRVTTAINPHRLFNICSFQPNLRSDMQLPWSKDGVPLWWVATRTFNVNLTRLFHEWNSRGSYHELLLRNKTTSIKWLFLCRLWTCGSSKNIFTPPWNQPYRDNDIRKRGSNIRGFLHTEKNSAHNRTVYLSKVVVDDSEWSKWSLWLGWPNNDQYNSGMLANSSFLTRQLKSLPIKFGLRWYVHADFCGSFMVSCYLQWLSLSRQRLGKSFRS